MLTPPAAQSTAGELTDCWSARWILVKLLVSGSSGRTLAAVTSPAQFLQVLLVAAAADNDRNDVVVLQLGLRTALPAPATVPKPTSS